MRVVCPNCDAELPDTDGFCSYCGAPLEPKRLLCRECRTPNPPTSKFCSECGASLRPMSVPREVRAKTDTQTPQPVKLRKGKASDFAVILILAASLSLVCMIGAILAARTSPDDSERAGVAGTKPAMPTKTPRPVAPRFVEIRANVQSMTEAQWKKYLDELAGYRVYKWRGWVVEVDKELSGNYEVWIDMDSPEELLSVQDVYFDVPENVALQLAKGQQVTFSGTIKRVSELLGSVSVHLVDAKFE